METRNETYYNPGLDEPETTTEQTTAEESKKPRLYVPWMVGGEEYKLRLTSGVITKLEAKFKDSLLNVVLDKGIPPVSTVITILQAGLQKYHHGLKVEAVGDLYDDYIAEGHTQIDLLSEVLLPLMGDAGFFTQAQLRMMQTEILTEETEPDL